MLAQLLYDRLGNCQPGDTISISAGMLRQILSNVEPDFEITDSEDTGDAHYTVGDLVHCGCAACR